MKVFEITSCLRNTQGEQLGTVLGVLRVPPFTPKSLNGKIYWVTKAEVSAEMAFGKAFGVMGIIFDQEKGWEYALPVTDFNRFMETGDLSLLPKESKSRSTQRTPGLLALTLTRTEKIS
jgi:hypothetical protein